MLQLHASGGTDPACSGRRRHRCSNLSDANDANACAAGSGPAGASTAGEVRPHALLVAGVGPSEERNLLLHALLYSRSLACAAWLTALAVCSVELSLP